MVDERLEAASGAENVYQYTDRIELFDRRLDASRLCAGQQTRTVADFRVRPPSAHTTSRIQRPICLSKGHHRNRHAGRSKIVANKRLTPTGPDAVQYARRMQQLEVINDDVM